MKFSNAALAVLPFPFVAFTQLVSRTKAASTTGLTIADGMVVELCEGSNITVDVRDTPALIVGDGSSNGGASLTITGGSYKSIYDDGMEVKGGSFATVLGGMIQGGQYGGGMLVYGDGSFATVLGGMIQGGLRGDGMFVREGAVATVLGGMIQGGLRGDGMHVGSVATVCDGTIQGATGWYGQFNHGGFVYDEATVRIAGGIIIGGNSTNTASASGSPGGNAFRNRGNLTITGGTFKGGFNSASGDQAPSLDLKCGNTSIYGGTYEGNWFNYDNFGFCDSSTKVYGKDLVVEGNHLMGTLCDGNLIDVYILGETSTVYTENNCTSFPKFDECGGKGGKSGKKTKSSLFRP